MNQSFSILFKIINYSKYLIYQSPVSTKEHHSGREAEFKSFFSTQVCSLQICIRNACLKIRPPSSGDVAVPPFRPGQEPFLEALEPAHVKGSTSGWTSFLRS
jgi:hypothetical protein